MYEDVSLKRGAFLVQQVVRVSLACYSDILTFFFACQGWKVQLVFIFHFIAVDV